MNDSEIRQGAMTVIEEIAAERRRQIEAEGWSPEHDDLHDDESLALAAACYAGDLDRFRAIDDTRHEQLVIRHDLDRCVTYYEPWPWESDEDKRTKHDRRRELVIAAALMVAEIERLDRAAGTAVGPELEREDLDLWWELSYATWLTLPRVLMQSMSKDWRGRMARLLFEWQDTWTNPPVEGTRVQITDARGRLVSTPDWLLNYRRPDHERVAACRGHGQP